MPHYPCLQTLLGGQQGEEEPQQRSPVFSVTLLPPPCSAVSQARLALSESSTRPSSGSTDWSLAAVANARKALSADAWFLAGSLLSRLRTGRHRDGTAVFSCLRAGLQICGA